MSRFDFDGLLQEMRRPASHTSKLTGPSDTIKISYNVFVDLNKKIEPSMIENEHAREIGLTAMQGLIIG